MARAPRVWDVAIIGAGAAGLAAASRLSAEGRSVVMLEARDRIGGRIFTRSEPGVPIPIELGAEFIHGEPDISLRLMRQAGLVAANAPSDHWTLRNGKLESRDDSFDDVLKLMQRAAKLKQDMSVAAFLSKGSGGKAPPKVRQRVLMLVEGFDAADPESVSVRAIAEEWLNGALGDTPQSRPLGGYGALMNALAGAIDPSKSQVLLSTRVQRVTWSKGLVRLQGDRRGEPFETSARCAIVTLPVSLLQLPPDAPEAVRFEPPLKEKHKALSGVAMGPVIKVVLHFREAFWERVNNQCYQYATFFHAPDALFPTFWTSLPLRVPLLIAWAGGSKAKHFAAADDNSIVQSAFASVKSVFGADNLAANALEGAYVHHWQRDPFSRGAYSFETVGGHRARANLAKPLQGTLFFAGEATDDEDASTVAGALNSGERAARQVLAEASNNL